MIDLEEYSYMNAKNVKFYRNTAFYNAGAIYVGTFSYMDVMST